MDNYYRALNVEPTATADEIKKAIHRNRRVCLNKTNSPNLDRRQEADRMVKLLDEAEVVLLDPAKRQKYDFDLQMAPTNQPQAGAQTAGGQKDWVKEGRRYLGIGDIPNALYAATQATQTDGGNPEAWALSGQAKFLWGDARDAVYEYRRAISLRPNEAIYYFELGAVYESTEAWSDALQQYQRAAQIDPSATMYRASMGLVFLRIDRYRDAIAILTRCVAEDPQNVTYQEFLAIAYADGSYEHWTRVPEGNKAGVPAGYYATTKQQVDEALASVQMAMSLNVQTPELTGAIAEIHANIHSMLKRRFHGNWLVVVAAGLTALSALSGSLVGLYFLACGILYTISCYTPQYVLNRKIIGGGGTTSMSFMASMAEGEGGCTRILISLVFILICLPVMIVYNFMVNYPMGSQQTVNPPQQQQPMVMR